MLQDKFSDLSLALEGEAFVEYQGDFFCIRETCEGCDHISHCTEQGYVDGTEFVGDTKPLEDKMILPARAVVSSKTNVESDEYTPFPFVEESDVDISDFGDDASWRVEGKNRLNHGNKIILKKMISLGEVLYENRELEYILYNPDDKEYYCVRQVCSLCEHREYCKVDVIIKEADRRILSLDMRSQEPRAFSMLSKEPNWLKIFRNDSLRNNPSLLMYIDEIFKKELEIDTDRSVKYWKFLDHHFFEDYTFLYELNKSVIDYKRDRNDSNREKVSEMIETVKKMWSDF